MFKKNSYSDEAVNVVYEGYSACEMAQLGVFSNESLEVWIYASEGPVPHFHFKNSAKNIEGCIKLTASEYFSHNGKGNTLNSSQRKALMNFLFAPSEDLPTITNWQALVFLWNSNNRNYQIPNNTPMPDYSLLKN